MTLGDVVSQQAIEKKGSNHDFTRSFRMTVYGALIGGPVIGTWFGFINKAITMKNKFAGKLCIRYESIMYTCTDYINIISNDCTSGN